MVRAYLILKFAAVLALTGFASLVLWDMHLRLREAGPLLTEARRTVLVVGGAATNVEMILRDERAASKEQFAASTAMLKEAKATISQAKQLIANTDRSLNADLVPRIGKALDSTNALGVEAADSLRRTTDNLQPAIADLTRASASLADTLADPAIRQSVEHLAEASAGMADSSRSLAGVAEDFKQVADKFRETYTKPGSTIWATMKALVHLVFETRGALGK